MKITFIVNSKAELLKSKGTSAIWLTFIAAAFLPAIHGIILIERPDVFMQKFASDPWSGFLRMNWKNGASVILPLFVILLNNAIAQIEYKNNTWKQVYSSPRSYMDIFFSKFLIVHLYLICFFISFDIFMIASGYFVGFFQKGYHFSSSSVSWAQISMLNARLYTGILAVSAIQYWLSVRFKNFIVPLGIGIALWVTGIVLLDWDKIIYYPYMYTTLLFFIDSPKPVGTLYGLLTASVICFAVAISVAAVNISLLKERG